MKTQPDVELKILHTVNKPTSITMFMKYSANSDVHKSNETLQSYSLKIYFVLNLCINLTYGAVDITTRYGLDGPGIESRWE